MNPDTIADIAATDFSLYDLFIRADIIVKLVMGLLVSLSVWTWALALDKWLTLGGAISKAKQFEKAFWSGQPLEELSERQKEKPQEAMARVYSAASAEWKDVRHLTSMTTTQADALIARAERSMQAATDRELSRLEKGLGTLATIGSVSPFVGLFGTVWGIMNAFRDIAAQGSTNLAVVAPGIAEALFATALGLVAAIPAVVFYNKFTSDAGTFSDRLDTFTQEFVVRMSRRLSERKES